VNKCHLITVSNIRKAYSMLPLNRMAQIYGRCRNGVLSDTIIYSSNKNRFYFNINRYREDLKYKAEKIICLLDAADKMVADEEKRKKKLVKKLFKRIKHLIIEKADEKLFSNTVFRLIRKDIFDNSIQTAYFNIDALCEKMQAFSKLYSHREGLPAALLEQKYEILSLSSEDLEVTMPQKEKENEVEKKRKKIVDEDLIEAKENIIGLYQTGVLDQRIDKMIRFSKRHVQTFYERVKRHYPYIDINVLCDKLLENTQRKAYRNLNNAISFWVLDKNHPFKIQVKMEFKKGKTYTSEEITEILNPILNRYFHREISQNGAVGFFKSVFETVRTNTRKNMYMITGKNPLKLPKPLETISKQELLLQQYFELVSSD
jgi:DNA replication initiation complex subunit (GINS family)